MVGLGECSIIKGLSPDNALAFEGLLHDIDWSVDASTLEHIQWPSYPALNFAKEMALIDLKNGGRQIYYESPFISGNHHIDINGLIWMGDKSFMRSQIKEKIADGFRCVKMKIGAIDFDTEYGLLTEIRREFSKDDIELRVDANGAYRPSEAYNMLCRLSELDLHSIEQPIMPGQIDAMADLCARTPLPIALDEELIGVSDIAQKSKLISDIQPQYIILKPSLVGGFQSSQEWINLARANKVGWWITSALESNVGLNAIAQWTATLDAPMFQGLGTGQLFTNNFESPLYLKSDRMFYRKS